MSANSKRQAAWGSLRESVFDVAVVGGGIKGACLYHHLRHDGCRALLIDKGDFGGGTSQASAQMIWGGILYLKHGDLRTVRQLSLAREAMLRQFGTSVKAQPFRYVLSRRGSYGPALMQAVLHFYWVMGGCRRQRPRYEPSYAELGFLDAARHCGSLLYEEACVEPSDARFVLQWILTAPAAERSADGVALNHCALAGGGFDRTAGYWRLELEDAFGRCAAIAKARCVVNAAGVWTDSINARFGMRSPYKHVLSKGVFIAVPRLPGHTTPILFETPDGDHRCLAPWGPVSLYGPTETRVESPAEGFAPQAEDVAFLLREINGSLRRPIDADDIVALRCGVRPLAADRGAREQPSQELSRRHRIYADPDRPWVSLYGSNLTNCIPAALKARDLLRARIGWGRMPPRQPQVLPSPPREQFPGLGEAVPSAEWCAEHELCCTLDDYLRRRTNIAQWLPRGGLGAAGENLPRLAKLACVLEPRDSYQALLSYCQKVAGEFDSVLSPAARPAASKEVCHVRQRQREIALQTAAARA